jgi:aminoglycoside/choline kinase family phosphotransferase
MTRDQRIERFLTAHGFYIADTLAPDASIRRYLRLRGPRPAVLMDAPPPNDIRPFLAVAAHLGDIGLSAPAIIAADPAHGLVLQEDLGDALLSMLLDSGSPQAAAALDAAVDALVAMQRAAPPPDLSSWDAPMMARTAAATLFDWWWPARYGTAAPDDARRDVEAALEGMLRPLADGPTTFVHRDFFAGNLFWLPDRADTKRIGIIDLQDAAIGHPAYDLASLIQDARRDIPPDLPNRAFARFLALRPELDAAAFQAAFDACAAQRHLRVAGQWIRLARRDGRPQYLIHGPRTWRLLADALRQPAAAPLAAALDRWIPADHRGNPPGLQYDSMP